MKKILILLIVFIVLLTSFSSVLSISTNNSNFKKENNQKKWTFMFYADGDWNGGWPLTNFLTEQKITSSNNISVIVLEDTPEGPAKLWYIDNSSSKILLEEKGEINMGDYKTLRDFINYSKQNYPAERYVINLWDHGSAWKGACMDITNVSGYYDMLSMDEMQLALQQSGGVNIIGFSACVMGCIESAYELRNYTDVYIGSEEMHGMSIEWVQLADILDNFPNETTYNISYKIIDLFRKNYPYYGTLRDNIRSMRYCLKSDILPYPPALTISAIRTDKIESLVNSINNYSSFLIDNINFFKRSIKIARVLVEDFPRPMKLLSPMGTQIDIVDFIDLVEKPIWKLLKPELSEITEDIKDTLGQVLINEHHQVGHRKANGLSIYFPPLYPRSDYKEYDPYYANCSLDFSIDTTWDELLELIFLE